MRFARSLLPQRRIGVPLNQCSRSLLSRCSRTISSSPQPKKSSTLNKPNSVDKDHGEQIALSFYFPRFLLTSLRWLDPAHETEFDGFPLFALLGFGTGLAVARALDENISHLRLGQPLPIGPTFIYSYAGLSSNM
ncbi:hypothetical protein BC832DRAFT_554894 [Gaertneriomyces semiglobifer]|nr:hypothetical protein BC832DRAFT_554894 [Gaertneriomyces semiglobifer]